MEITDVSLIKVNGDKRRLRAVASVTLDNCFVLHELKLIEGEKGLFVAMPSKKVDDNDFRDIMHPIDKETRKMFEDVIIAKYYEQC